MDQTEICYLPATEMAAAIRAKALSPVEITQALLQRIEALNPRLNAYWTVTADRAMDAARRAEDAVAGGAPLGALHGVPVSFKDSMMTKGVPTTLGSKVFADNVPGEDAPLVGRILAAGAIMLGKTTMPEFAWKAMTDSPLQGVTRNPWNPDYTPGGSTGGGSAQVAAGMGPIAMGTDGGGSIRIPASFAGIYGIKPTFGRVPYYPSPAFDALSHAGPLARTVADAALALSAAAGPHAADRQSLEAPAADYVGELGKGVKGLKVAWSPDLGYVRAHPEVMETTSRAARVFEDLGCYIDEVDPGFGDAADSYRTIIQVGAAATVADFLPQWENDMDPGLVNLAGAGMDVRAVDFARAQAERHRFYDRVRRFFETYDLLLTPTVAVPPFKAGAPSPKPEHGLGEDWIEWAPFSFPFNLTHVPAASVPAGFTATGLPIGLQIVGPRFAELTVLQASAAYEEARPWADKRPPI